MNIQCLILLFVVALAPGATRAEPPAAAAPADTPPATRTVDAVDRRFGLVLPDPYRWMEGADNAEFNTWLQTQGTYARRKLDALPSLPAWRARLGQAAKAARRQGSHSRVGERIFFIRQEGEGTGTLMVREGDGTLRSLFDPATLPGPGRARIAEYMSAPDGHTVAVNLDRDGSEIAQVHLLDVDSGTLRSGSVGPVPGDARVEWLPDSSGFFYTRFAPEEEQVPNDPFQNLRVHLHRLDPGKGDDPLLFKAGSNPSLPLSPREWPSVTVRPASRWAVAAIGEARPEARICVAPLQDAQSPDTRWRCVAGYDDGIVGGELFGDTLYLQSTKGHPNRRVLALDLSAPDAALAHAREVLPESAGAVVKDLYATRDALYVQRMREGVDELLRIPHGGGEARAIALPFEGTVGNMSGSPLAAGLQFSLRGWTTPNNIYTYAPDTGTVTDLRLGSTSPADYSGLASTRIEAVSADGTRVPLSIVHRKDLRLDGSNRVLLFGYGAYGASMQPRFDALLLEWVKAGNVYAVAHVRGGGEKGEAWRLGGLGANKRNGIDDLLACAQALTARGYATPERIGIGSRSAGGLLIGGALARAPDKFGAAYIGVGWLNPVRLLHGPGGATHVPESGDPDTAKGLKVLAAMDPIQQLRDGTTYPPTLVEVGSNDPRVATWESGKFVARLQAANAGETPVWLRVQGDSGHWATTLDAEALERADLYAFLETHLQAPDAP